MNRYFILKKVVEFLRKYVFYLNRFLYCLSCDPKVEIIESLLNCRIVNSKGKYFGKYVSYLAVDYVNTDKIPQLEYALKTHVEVLKKDFNFIIKVYHKHCKLPVYVEYEPYNSKDMILGVGYNGLVKVPINTETNNFLICGCSSSGKSTLAISIIKNLIDNDVDCIIIDNKNSVDYDFLDCPVYKGIDNCLIQLQIFNREIDTLLSKGKKHKKLLIIDEIYPFLLLSSKEKKEAYNLLGTIMSKCRACDYHVGILLQRPTSDIIDGKILTHCSYRICLQTSSKQESINVLNCDIAFNISMKGRAYLSINGKITEFQSYYTRSEPKSVKKTDVEYGTIAKDIEYNENIESSKTLTKEKESFQNKFL